MFIIAAPLAYLVFAFMSVGIGHDLAVPADQSSQQANASIKNSSLLAIPADGSQ
ncbi:hypothetical protein [Aquitalea aquatica]|uniref:Uncharacterized protein n=1 Tax=Aquitalea aquatica TaxID=3044273 RepID=A0A838YI19_9NEIS|nr:hypothetical protein [Aquitalea magnusonii]MBA4710221.1 hypothetical protein [Aquitalea magnusonii]